MAAAKKPTKVPAKLRRDAKAMLAAAQGLANLADREDWWGRPSLLESLEKRVNAVLKAIDYKRTPVDIEANVITFIEAGGKSVSREDCRLTLAQATKLYTGHIDGLLRDAGMAHDVDPDLVRCAIEAFASATRGRPRTGQPNQRDALGALLISLGFIDESIDEAALTKHITRRRHRK